MKKIPLLYSCLFLFCSILLSSCNIRGGEDGKGALGREIDVEYAQGFRVTEYENYKLVEIVNPWDTTTLLNSYILVDRELKELPDNLPTGVVVRTPITKAAIYNSVHTSIFEALESTESIMGICEVKYIYSERLKKLLDDKIIYDLGQSTQPNIERMIDGECDVIIVSPFNNCNYGAAEKIGVPIVEIADYMENTPLGRTEWIKLFGLLLGKESCADSIFNSCEYTYREIAAKVADIDKRPAIFTERKYGSMWHVPANDSYMVNMYKDAGADYVFDDIKGSDSRPMQFEEVLDRAMHADIWLIKYYNEVPMSYDMLKAEYEPYSRFDAFKNGTIIGCNTATNRYYEDLPLHPELILKDLINIFHPGIFPEYQQRYFIPLIQKLN